MTASTTATAAPTASETAATLQKLLKRTRKHRANERDDAARLDELRRVFASLPSRGELLLRGGGNNNNSSEVDDKNSDGDDGADVKSKWSAYLRRKHAEFLSQLSAAVSAGRKSALRTYCGVVAGSPRVENDMVMVDEQLLKGLLEALITSGGDSNSTTGAGMDEQMLNLLDGEFLKPHPDARYFALLAIRQIAGEIYASSEKNDKREKGEDAITNAADDAGARAESLLRILLRIDVSNTTDASLADGEAFLVAPPPSREMGSGSSNDSDEEGDNDDDGDDNDDGEDDGDSDDASDSNASDDDEDNDGRKKRKRSNGEGGSSSKKARRSAATRPTWQRASRHRRALQEAWLALLKIPVLPNRALKRALQHLPTSVLPVVPAPLRFADVCTRSYEVGGVTSLLALHSLFVLMMEHGLEYPKFYASLYGLVTPRNFYAKHRTRFFRLLTNCLTRSDMLPAYVVAAFCKRLCRCALSAPPSGALFVLALVSNLLRRHGECACLVHRKGGGGKGSEMEDRFDPNASDPAEARALESSLWELAALERHFHPAVATLAKSVGTETETTPMHDMDEFLLHTYKSLFEMERKRNGATMARKAVPVTFAKPPSLFVADDVFAGILSVPSPTGVEDDR